MSSDISDRRSGDVDHPPDRSNLPSPGTSDEILSALASCAETVQEIEDGAEQRVTPCGDGQMHWRLWGSGPPLILLHGDFGSWTHWLRNVLPLAQGFQVIVPDLPGYGDSDMPTVPWSPESLARILREGLAEIVPPPQRYGLAGFSFGGIIAGHLAAQESSRVTRLLLLGPGGFALPGGTPGPLLRLKAGMNPKEVSAVHRHNLAALMIADAQKVDDLAVHLQIENVRQTRIKAGTIPDSDTLLRVLPDVAARIYGMWGGSDAMTVPYVPEHEAVLRRFQRDLEFYTVESAGHWAPYECPAEVNAILARVFGAELA